jgi:hypothetical protein
MKLVGLLKRIARMNTNISEYGRCDHDLAATAINYTPL